MTKENAVTDQTSVPTHVPVQIAPITQKELRAFIALSNQLEKLEAEYKTQELSLKNLLAAGAEVQKGIHVAILKVGERTNVSWKSEAVHLADAVYGLGKGEEWAQEIKAQTPPTPTITLDVH